MKTTITSVRLPDKLREELIKQAVAEGRTLSNLIIYILERRNANNS